MRAGKVVEQGSRYDVIRNPQHPYTRSLIESLPDHQPLATTSTDTEAPP